jgi:asparagine synthase (glutamine-hydrolysing)
MDRVNTHFTIQRKGTVRDKSFPFVNDKNQCWEVVGDHPNFLTSLNDSSLLIYGDCINADVFSDSTAKLEECLKKAKGHFTIVIVGSNQVKVAGSCFSFLPVYYSECHSIVSNCWETMTKFSRNEVSEVFILETHLFNYPLGDTTMFKDILLLKSFQCINLEFDFTFYDIENLPEWFHSEIDNDLTTKELAKRFIETTKCYFTSSQELITFTSGFDGRTILAHALANNLSVQTFSMGRLDNDDVAIPKKNSLDINIPFEALDLSKEDFQTVLFDLAKELSSKSGGGNGFLYPHFIFSAKYYSRFETMMVGFCGSELFRALHVAGAVTSEEMVSIFRVSDDEELKSILFKSERLKFLKADIVERAKSQVWANVQELRKERVHYKTVNHFFYSFIFRQVFRKVFGLLTSGMFDNLKVRTPFLDFEFVQLLLRSSIAGCNNDFFTHNPLKRYKGQLLYAQIMKELNSPLLLLMTGKKYRPIQLLSPIGQLSIVLPFIMKKLNKQRNPVDVDNLTLVSGFKRSWDSINKTLIAVDQYYSIQKVRNAVENMHNSMSLTERDTIFQIASFSVVLHQD